MRSSFKPVLALAVLTCSVVFDRYGIASTTLPGGCVRLVDFRPGADRPVSERWQKTAALGARFWHPFHGLRLLLELYTVRWRLVVPRSGWRCLLESCRK